MHPRSHRGCSREIDVADPGPGFVALNLDSRTGAWREVVWATGGCSLVLQWARRDSNPRPLPCHGSGTREPKRRATGRGQHRSLLLSDQGVQFFEEDG